MKKLIKKCLYIFFCVALVLVVMKKQQWGFFQEIYTVNTVKSELLLIGHAGGSLEIEDGSKKKITNAKEAFYQNYQKGLRYFEGDLVYTSDFKIVLRHRWGTYLYDFLGQKQPVTTIENKAISYNELMNNHLFGKYESMDIGGLIVFLKEHPDAYFITDIKDDSMEILSELVEIVNEESILKRIIPQIYSLSEYNEVRTIYKFPEIYLTLYNSPDSNEEILEFIKKNPLGAVVCGSDIFEKRKELIPEVHKKGIAFYVHTINSLEELKIYEKYLIDGVYTDTLREQNNKIINK